MGCLLGLDIGTSSCKAVVTEPAGGTGWLGASSYRIDTPRPGWAEQDPEAWWSACGLAVREAVRRAGIGGRDVTAIGLSGQMYGVVLLDGRLQVLRSAIIWADSRSSAESERAGRLLGRDLLRNMVCNRSSTGFSASKILWVEEHEPFVFTRTMHVLFPKDYVRLRMTGEVASEPSDASSAYGAAFLAGLGTGEYAGAEEVRAVAGSKRVSPMPPDERNAETYGSQFELFRRLYPSLRAVNRRLSGLPR